MKEQHTEKERERKTIHWKKEGESKGKPNGKRRREKRDTILKKKKREEKNPAEKEGEENTFL